MTVWIGTSWKMNKTRAEAAEYARVLDSTKMPDDTIAFVVPAFTSIDVVRGVLGHHENLLIGAQNGHWEAAGAWTGELSMSMIKDAGAELVTLGHSERREHFGETDETVNLKVHAALAAGIRPLVCVGEPISMRSMKESVDWVLGQVDGALAGLDSVEASRVLIAYEPIWAIGNGRRSAKPKEISPMHRAIAEWATTNDKRPAALLYGGSVTEQNAAEIIAVPNVDGLFVGRAGWDADSFQRLIAIAGKQGVL